MQRADKLTLDKAIGVDRQMCFLHNGYECVGGPSIHIRGGIALEDVALLGIQPPAVDAMQRESRASVHRTGAGDGYKIVAKLRAGTSNVASLAGASSTCVAFRAD